MSRRNGMAYMPTMTATRICPQCRRKVACLAEDEQLSDWRCTECRIRAEIAAADLWQPPDQSDEHAPTLELGPEEMAALEEIRAKRAKKRSRSDLPKWPRPACGREVKIGGKRGYVL